MSPQYLNAICGRARGQSASELIAEQIVLEGKRYLLHTDLSITEVAEQLGFTDPSHFVNYFKKMTGHTPAFFRKLHGFQQARYYRAGGWTRFYFFKTSEAFGCFPGDSSHKNDTAMNTVRWYSPEGEEDKGGSSASDRESILRQEGPHEPGDTPLDDQEELPGGFIHGHVDQGNDDE